MNGEDIHLHLDFESTAFQHSQTLQLLLQFRGGGFSWSEQEDKTGKNEKNAELADDTGLTAIRIGQNQVVPLAGQCCQFLIHIKQEMDAQPGKNKKHNAFNAALRLKDEEKSQGIGHWECAIQSQNHYENHVQPTLRWHHRRHKQMYMPENA